MSYRRQQLELHSLSSKESLDDIYFLHETCAASSRIRGVGWEEVWGIASFLVQRSYHGTDTVGN